MARKKKEDTPAPGSPAWMATFSDLMNLLLCFFVLLFSMSSIDQGKAEALIQSLANTFSIFDGGGSSFGEGNMISNGADQLSELDEYFSTMGQTDEGDIEQNVTENENGGESEDNTGAAPSVTPTPVPTMTPDQAIYEENKGQSLIIYDEVIDITNKYNLGDYVEVGIDADHYEYITIEIKGHLLFAPGEADLVKEAEPIISKIGDVLKQYTDYKVEVIGHTDSLPQYDAPYYNNDVLSFWRARTVALYLVETKNLDRDNVEFTGKGEQEPVADNDTEDGRRMNRRVEIRLYNKKNSGN